MLSIASYGETFHAMGEHSDDSLSAELFDIARGTRKPLHSNIGWLLRHTNLIHDLFVRTDVYVVIGRGYYRPSWSGAGYEHNVYSTVPMRTRERRDCILAVRLEDGRVFVENWQSQEVLHDFLLRGDKFRGRPVHWDHHMMVIGDRDYERAQWQRRKRHEREMRYRAEHPEQFTKAS